MVLDANVWVSLLLDEDAHHALSDAWFRGMEETRQLFFGPYLLLPEVCGAISRRTGDSQAAEQIMRRLAHLSVLQLLPLDRGLAIRAARLAAELRLRGADAVYVATAQALGVPLVTWDGELLERTAPAVEVRKPATDSGAD